jgi:membrane-bound lytic murein transglycosylase D
VSQFVRFYRRHPGYIQRVFERGRPFLPYILDELDAHDVPPAIALLPVVESAFRPFAYSPGRAAGIWQFIPGTGRNYGLEQSWWYDGRRDVLAATGAAIDYLTRLHERFDSWLLAVAAYNCGEGRVAWAIRHNRARGKPTDFWHLNLPRETSAYVPKLIALAHVVKDPARFGLELPEMPLEKGFTVAELDAPIDLSRAAELAGVSVDTLYRLNPGLNRWCTPPDGPHRLVLPKGVKGDFQEALAALDDSERVRWVRHRIRRGQTLSEIATDYRTTTEVLRQVNDLRGSHLIAGEHLVIPTALSGQGTYRLSKAQRVRSRQQDGPSGRRRITYRVQSGDTFWELAQRYGVSVHRLARWNHMAPGDTLHTGQKLAIWVQPGSRHASRSAGPGNTRLTYRVRRGDSLWTIAQDFNVSTGRLRAWNGLGEGQPIHPGDRLKIFVDVTRLAEHRG